ncbi:MAG TPA: class I SAM-dependent methyltransferase [Streptosporangiaceae bacterium]|nr:class I SAM-dependent methyltransferase [Streptosporangiaceae bacterium]
MGREPAGPAGHGELAGHPDRVRWNARYSGGIAASFAAHPLAARALSMGLPAGPVLDLACGPSGSALRAAAAGRRVTAVDASEVALGLLGQEARRRGLSDLITLVHADLGAWRPEPGSYALVLCTGYWDGALFAPAATAVAAGGLLAWEAFTAGARTARPGLRAPWCLRPGEPASLLPANFDVVDQHDLPDSERGTKRSLLALRRATPKRSPGRLDVADRRVLR